MRRFWTVVVGRGAVQLLTYVDLFLASLLAVGAVSALTYAQVLYLLPISLFGMAVAAAELPELSRLGRSGAVAMRDRLGVGLERITFYVALAAALYLFAGRRHHRRAAAAGRVRRRRHPPRLVHAGGLLARAAGHHPIPPAPERPLRPRPSAAGGAHRRAPSGAGGPDRRHPHVPARSVRHHRVEHPAGRGPRLRTARGRAAAPRGRTTPPRDRRPGHRRGGVVVGRVPPAARAPSSGASGAIDEFGHDTRWSLLSALGAGVLAAGLRSVTDHLPSLVALVIVVGVPALTYLGITATMQGDGGPRHRGPCAPAPPGLIHRPG